MAAAREITQNSLFAIPYISPAVRIAQFFRRTEKTPRFRKTELIRVYLGRMYKVLFVTPENDWVPRLPLVFPDLDLQVENTDSSAKALSRQQESPAEVIVFDLEYVRSSGNPIREVKHVAGESKIILIAPSDFSPEPEDLRDPEIQVLRKPITAGEIGLALSRAKRAS